jgi:hypothetical protein
MLPPVLPALLLQCEDPTLWHDRRGYHIMVHNQDGGQVSAERSASYTSRALAPMPTVVWLCRGRVQRRWYPYLLPVIA